MNENYIVINGKRIELSEKTVKRIKEQLKEKKINYYFDIIPNLRNCQLKFNETCYKHPDGSIINISNTSTTHTLHYSSDRQIVSLLALNKLINVAKYLNDKEGVDKFPDWENDGQFKWSIYFNNGKEFDYIYTHNNNRGSVYFRSYKLAREAVRILGEETIRKALTLNF